MKHSKKTNNKEQQPLGGHSAQRHSSNASTPKHRSDTPAQRQQAGAHGQKAQPDPPAQMRQPGASTQGNPANSPAQRQQPYPPGQMRQPGTPAQRQQPGNPAQRQPNPQGQMRQPGAPAQRQQPGAPAQMRQPGAPAQRNGNGSSSWNDPSFNSRRNNRANIPDWEYPTYATDRERPVYAPNWAYPKYASGMEYPTFASGPYGPLTKSESRAKSREEAEQRSRLKRRIALVAAMVGAVLILVLVIGALLGMNYVKGIDDKIAMDAEAIDQLNKVLVAPEAPVDPYYVLFLGSDSRDPANSEAGRSDSIILVRVDPEVPVVSLLSIPRDTRIELGGYSYQRINAAFAYYGPAGVVRVVSDLCDVEISYYVEVDFWGLMSLVNQLGGVDVVVPVDINLNNDFIPAGKQHLNGYQALVMSRCRNFPDGDYQRMKNQRILLQAILKEILSANKYELPGLVSALADSVKTNIGATEAAQLLLKLQDLDTKNSLYMVTVPSYTSNIDGVSYVVIDDEAFVAMLENFKAGLPPE